MPRLLMQSDAWSRNSCSRARRSRTAARPSPARRRSRPPMRKDRAAVPALMPLLMSGDRAVVIETIRALGRIGDPSTLPPLLNLVQGVETEAHVRLEAVSALAGFHDANAPGLLDTLLDLLTDK